MEEQEIGSEAEVVDRKTLPWFLSVSIGAGITFVLGLMPGFSIYLPFVNYLIGGLVAVWHYTKTHEVSIEMWHGVRISFMATLLGGVLIMVATNIIFYNEKGSDISDFKEELILELEKRGDDESIELIENNFPNELTPGLIVAMNLVMFMIMGVITFLISLFTGWLGARRFRRGPMAL